METLEAHTPTGRQEPPGVMLIGRIQRGLAAALRLVRHEGAVGTRLPNGGLGFECASPASTQWLGWYSKQIVANGWQPYDQPHGAAYIPVGFGQLATREVSSEGLLLRQNVPERARKIKTAGQSFVVACSEAEVPSTLAHLLERSGLSAACIEQAVRFLLTLDSTATNAA